MVVRAVWRVDPAVVSSLPPYRTTMFFGWPSLMGIFPRLGSVWYEKFLHVLILRSVFMVGSVVLTVPIPLPMEMPVVSLNIGVDTSFWGLFTMCAKVIKFTSGWSSHFKVTKLCQSFLLLAWDVSAIMRPVPSIKAYWARFRLYITTSNWIGSLTDWSTLGYSLTFQKL